MVRDFASSSDEISRRSPAVFAEARRRDASRRRPRREPAVGVHAPLSERGGRTSDRPLPSGSSFGGRKTSVGQKPHRV